MTMNPAREVQIWNKPRKKFHEMKRAQHVIVCLCIIVDNVKGQYARL